MKISLQLIITGALVVVLVVCCLVTYFGGAEQRETGAAHRQARAALAGKDKNLVFGGAEAPMPDNAIEPLERLVELRPDEYGIQATLVGLYLSPKTRQLDKARALCTKISSDRNPDKALRAVALIHLGMIEGAEATDAKAKPEMRAAGLGVARKRFEEALVLDPQSGDACVGLGLIALWEGRAEEAAKQFAEALKPGRKLGAETAPELHNGLGLALAAAGNLNEARKEFEAAEQSRKFLGEITKSGSDWKVPAANSRLIEEGTAGAQKMDPAVRKRLLAALEERLKAVKAPAQRFPLLNPVGCGHFHLGELAAAAARLEEAVKIDPSRIDILTNLMAVRCASLTKCREAFDEAVKKAVGQSAESAEVKAVSKARSELAAAEAAFDKLAPDYLAKGSPTPEMHAQVILNCVEMRLRLAASEKDKDKAKADKLLAEADKMLAEGLAKFPEDARLIRLSGIRDLNAGRVREGLEKFNRSLGRNGAQPDLRAIADEFAKPLEIVGFRPASIGAKAGPILASSPKPLLGVLFRTNTGPIPLDPQKVRLLLDGTPQPGTFWGTEYLSMPDNELADGEHVLTAEGEDAMGHKAKGEIRFLVDASPPEIASTEPASGGSTKGPRPRLVVVCKDKYSGVDPTSVEIEIRTGKAGAQSLLTDFPVRGGRYTYTYEPMDMKKNAMAGEEKFVFTTTRDIGLGHYDVTVSVGDQRGAKTTKVWSFVVTE
ncbi:MAG TPA: hypothetical protein PK280_08490 [Planctomycetota bacterium]|nr:hypothetical protein [Planctomycetota bacterium]